MKKFALVIAALVISLALTGTVFAKDLAASLKVDVTSIKAADGQSLIVLNTEVKQIPKRPANPDEQVFLQKHPPVSDYIARRSTAMSEEAH